MIKMTDKKLVELLFKIADWHQDTCVTELNWAKDDILYMLEEFFWTAFNEDSIWEKDENCRISDPMQYWKGLIEEYIKERFGKDIKLEQDLIKTEILKELKKIGKLLEER